MESLQNSVGIVVTEPVHFNVLLLLQHRWIYSATKPADISNAAELKSSKQTQRCDIISAVF